MSKIELRYYQNDLIDGIEGHWNAGARNVVAVSPTGSGKSATMARLLKRHNVYSTAIAHRQELVSQIALALAKDGVPHKFIAPDAVRRNCIRIQEMELGYNTHDPLAKVAVAGVDTLIRLDPSDQHLRRCELWGQDESHHVITTTKWGKAAEMMPNALGFGVTATPLRADGKGLGRHADGLFDAMVVGPSMRHLINEGFLTDYRIFAPPSDVDLTDVKVSEATGDFNQDQVRKAVHKSHIVGDMISHYMRISPGKRAIAFVVDVEAATETAQAFINAGIPAASVSAKTPDLERAVTLRRFRAGELKILVNVDLFGEGFDVPACEVVIMGRPTQSYGLFCLDPETEVLTPDGWVGSDGDLSSVIAFDRSTGETRGVVVTDYVKRPLYDEEVMYSLDGPHLNMMVSDKHNLVLKGRGKTCVNWNFQTAEDASRRAGLFCVPVSGNGHFGGADLTDDELRFLGWFLSDGCLNRSTNSVQIAQSVSKFDHVQGIANAIMGCGMKFGAHISRRKDCPETHHDLIVFSISHGKPRGRDKHLRGWGYLSKWIDKSIPDCYDTLNAHQIRVLLETWNLGDGANNHSSLDYIKRTLTITTGDNRRMADRLQALCVQRGLRCNISVSTKDRDKPLYNCHIREASFATVAGNNCKDGSISGKKPYKRSRLVISDQRPAFVWCVTNPLGTLITRRNGKVAIVGNCQQFGRALRPVYGSGFDLSTVAGRRMAMAAAGKTHGIIIDHVGNVLRHGLPDAPRDWTLDRRERRSRSAPNDVIPTRACPDCTAVYERTFSTCPYCGYKPEPAGRSLPEQVDGDLIEMDPAALAQLRGEIERVDGQCYTPQNVERHVAGAIRSRHHERQQAQQQLRAAMNLWAGYWRDVHDATDSQSYRRFYMTFGVDVATAQTLGAKEAYDLMMKVIARVK